MRQPYTVNQHIAGLDAKLNAALQAKSDKFYADHGVTYEIESRPMPLGGNGWKLCIYEYDIEVPNGMQGIADLYDRKIQSMRNTQ